jgi:diguanylate cyclase (GGDEF)-like protein/PAS domain S-box-containing protein
MSEKDDTKFDAPQYLDTKEKPDSSLSSPTETIELDGLLTESLTASGSYDVSHLRRSSLGKLLQMLPMPALLIDISLTITYCNEAWGSIVRPYTKLLGAKAIELAHSEADKESLSETLLEVFDRRRPKIRSYKFMVYGKPFWGRMVMRPIRLADNRLVLALVEDLTLERRQLLLMDTIRRAHNEWEQTFNAAPDMIATLDMDYRIKRLNRSMAKRAGVDAEKAVGKTCYQVVHKLDEPPPYCELARILGYEKDREFDYEEPSLGGFFTEKLTPIKDERDNLVGCVCVISDQTERQRMRDEVRRLTSHDPLTGLLNLGQMLNLLKASCQTSRRYKQPLSISICDVDCFGAINERFGAAVSNSALQRFGALILEQCRAADTAARYGGDEFIIAFPNTTARGAAECMERIRVTLSGLTFTTEDSSFAVTCTCGVAEFHPDRMDSEDLIREAHVALYSGKGRGRNCVVVKD